MMKVFLLICVLFITSSAAPVSEEAQAKVLQYDNTNDGKGNYEFNFETSNGIRRVEFGTLVNEGQPDEHIEVQGHYSYTDPDGKLIVVNYTADENGYHTLPSVTIVESLNPSLVASLLGGG